MQRSYGGTDFLAAAQIGKQAVVVEPGMPASMIRPPPQLRCQRHSDVAADDSAPSERSVRTENLGVMLRPKIGHGHEGQVSARLKLIPH